MHALSSSDEQMTEDYSSSGGNGQLFGNLLPELFLQILDTVYWLHRRSGLSSDTNWTVPYQLVCRRWRDIICSTPQFWQQIHVCSRPKWLDFCLTRCAGAPATVWLSEPTFPDETFATLCRHASSIRACHLYCDVPTLDYLSGLPLLLATPMPALETLALIGPYYEGENLDVPITHDLVPRLTSLDLWNSTAPRDAAVYTSLRSLTFLGTTWEISYDEFLDLMGKCRDLEYLKLDEEVLDPFTEEIAASTLGNSRDRTQVILPRLRTLILSGQRDLLFSILATIRAPQAITIELTNCVDDEETGPLISRLFSPNPELRFPFLSSPRTVSICCWEGDPFNVRLLCGPDSKARLSVDYGMVHNEEWPGNAYLEHNLVAVMDCFSGASVDTLEVCGYIDQIAVRTWQRVFEAFPGLRKLYIGGKGTLDSLWQGLLCATRTSLEHNGVVCCPSLSEIGADDGKRIWSWKVHRFRFTATNTLFEIVRETLRVRSDGGANRLEKLELRLEYSDELWNETSELREEFVEDLKALVEELDYRDGRTKIGYELYLYNSARR